MRLLIPPLTVDSACTRLSPAWLRLRAALLFVSTLCIAPTAWSETAAFGPDFPHSITVPYSGNLINYSDLPVSNVTGASYSNMTTPTYGFSVTSIGAPSPTNILLNFTPGIPPNGTTVGHTIRISITNAPWSNGTNRPLTILVDGPPDFPPQFINGFTTGTNAITNIFTTNQVTFQVPTTNADFLTVVSNLATANLNLANPGNPAFTKNGSGFAPTNTNDFADQSAFGTLAYYPGTNAATNTFQLIASNSVSLQAITSTVSIVSVPLKPLQVRVINKSGVPDSQVQIMQIDTGTNAYPNTVYFNSAGPDVPLANGVSTNLNALPQTVVASVTNRTFYVSNSVSGTLWFCLSNVPYNKGAGGNPAVVNTKWSGLPFGDMELAYFGSGYDTADVTAINQLGIPMKLEMKTNPSAPVTLPDGLKGFTNDAQAAQILIAGLQIPGAPWFGPAPNTNLLTLVGPSSATAGGVVMGSGGNTNVPGPGPAPGSLHLGWPGFTFPSMSSYVNKVAVEQTNGTWTTPTVFVKTVGDPQSPTNSLNTFTFTGTLVFTTNTNTGDPNYLTPVPVLTNVSIFRSNPLTGTTNITGLAVRYTPDSGSAATAWFTSYIYGAPPSYVVPTGAPAGDSTGYLELLPNPAAWFAANDQGNGKWSANVLDSFLNDIAFAFAGGFVHSPVNGWTNGWVFSSSGLVLSNSNTGAPDTVIGTMVSSNWWNQTNLYSQLQPNSPILSPSNKVTWYSSYGDVLFKSAPDVYNHPISDRMKYIKFQPGLSLGEANLNTNVWLEITLFAPPSASGSGAAPAITSSTNVTNVYIDPSSLTGTPISYQVTAVNTNGGGIYVGSMPDGLGYNPATQMITGNLKTNVSGYVNIGLMAYNSNSASIAQLPIYVYASVAPNGFNNVVTNLDVGVAYLAPTNVLSPIPEGYQSALVPLSVSNNATSMVGSTQDVYFYITNGTLPRGLYLTNIVDPSSNEVFGYLYGVPVDINATSNVTLVATNPVGGAVTNLTLTTPGFGNDNNNPVTAVPVYHGSSSFTVTSGQPTNLVLNYSNSPTWFTNDPSTPLPPGLSFQVALNPDYGTASPTFVASLGGTPVGTPGTSTNITILAVNAYSTNSPPFVSGTNTNTITINFSDQPSPSYLSYSGWVAAWALPSTITNPTADPDGDGFDNNDEYAFGGNPTNPTPYLINISGSNISYLGLTNNAVPSPYTVQNTTNLATGPWTNYATTVTNATNQLNIPLPSYYQRKEFTVPITSGTNNFYRVIFSNQ